MLSAKKGAKMLRKVFNKKKNVPPIGALHDAVKYCDVTTLVRLLLRGVDVNSYDDHGVTALHVACEIGNSDLAVILLTMGAEVNLATSGETHCVPALVTAATHGNSVCVKVLLENGASPDACDHFGNTALFKAATYNHVNCVKLLLHYGATPDLSNQWKATPLQYGVLQDFTDIVRLLLSFGANPNQKGEPNYPSPIQSAVCKHHDCLDLLIAAGADVNTTMPSGVNLLNYTISDGMDISNDLYSVQLLLENGAEVNHNCIRSLAERCCNETKHLSKSSNNIDSKSDLFQTDSEKLGQELYTLVITLVTSLPTCDVTNDPRMHSALSCLFEVLNSNECYDCVRLLVKLGFAPSHLNLPKYLVEELGLLKQTESLMEKSIKVVQMTIKDFSKIHELPLPLCLKKSISVNINH